MTSNNTTVSSVPEIEQPAISVQGLTKTFGSNVVLQNLDCTVGAGRSLVVLGGSGSGKSVFFKCLTGLYPINAGELTVLGAAPGKALDDVGMLFQAGALFDSLRVWENIAFEGLFGRGKSKDSKARRLSRADARALAVRKLASVELEASVADRFPSEISGGMVKRVALARAVAFEPKLLLLDEPTAGLDPQRAAAINALIRRLVNEIGASAVTITHDLTTATTVADEVKLLHKGAFIWSGTPTEMLSTDDALMRGFIDPILQQQGLAARG